MKSHNILSFFIFFILLAPVCLLIAYIPYHVSYKANQNTKFKLEKRIEDFIVDQKFIMNSIGKEIVHLYERYPNPSEPDVVAILKKAVYLNEYTNSKMVGNYNFVDNNGVVINKLGQEKHPFQYKFSDEANGLLKISDNNLLIVVPLKNWDINVGYLFQYVQFDSFIEHDIGYSKQSLQEITVFGRKFIVRQNYIQDYPFFLVGAGMLYIMVLISYILVKYLSLYSRRQNKIIISDRDSQLEKLNAQNKSTLRQLIQCRKGFEKLVGEMQLIILGFVNASSIKYLIIMDKFPHIKDEIRQLHNDVRLLKEGRFKSSNNKKYSIESLIEEIQTLCSIDIHHKELKIYVKEIRHNVLNDNYLQVKTILYCLIRYIIIMAHEKGEIEIEVDQAAEMFNICIKADGFDADEKIIAGLDQLEIEPYFTLQKASEILILLEGRFEKSYQAGRNIIRASVPLNKQQVESNVVKLREKN